MHLFGNAGVRDSGVILSRLRRMHVFQASEGIHELTVDNLASDSFRNQLDRSIDDCSRSIANPA